MIKAVVKAESEHWFGLEAGVQLPVIESLYGRQDEHTTGHVALFLAR